MQRRVCRGRSFAERTARLQAGLEPIRLALIAVAAAATAWPAGAVLVRPSPPPVCDVVVEPGPAAARALASKVHGETWRRCRHVRGGLQHVAVKVVRSSKSVCTGRTESFFEGASYDGGASSLRSSWRDRGDPWGGGAAYRWAGVGPCPGFEPWRGDSATRTYVITDPRMSDAGFLKVTRYVERLAEQDRPAGAESLAIAGGSRWPTTMIGQRQWLFGLWRTYEVHANGPMGRYRRYTLLETVGRLWLLKARSGQVIY